MQSYKKMHITLFNAITDAFEHIKLQNCVDAIEILIRAQRETEELYINAEEYECNNRLISIDTYL